MLGGVKVGGTYMYVQVRDRLEAKLKEKNYLNSGTISKNIIVLVESVCLDNLSKKV